MKRTARHAGQPTKTTRRREHLALLAVMLYPGDKHGRRTR